MSYSSDKEMQYLNLANPQQSEPRKFLKVCLELCRVSNLPTIWTNVLAAMVLSGTGWTIGDYLVIAISISCFYTGGISLNDIWDAPFDAIHNPGRPLPSGRISMRAAWAMTITLFGTGLILLSLTLQGVAIFGGIILLSAILIYNRYHKKHPWSVFVMGACRLLIYAVSSLAIAGRLFPNVLIAGAAQFFYVLLLSVTS
jgi:4-hydroxybenzoate polyprenyltransferase